MSTSSLSCFVRRMQVRAAGLTAGSAAVRAAVRSTGKRRSVGLLLPIWTAILLTGCLTVESKEYHVTLRDDGSGEARIIFRNIQSENDDTTNTAAQDFQQLIDVYLLGNRFEKDNPGFRNVRKRLFEEDGKLCGQVDVSFDSLAALRIFKYDKEGPLMYFVGSPITSEVLQETNGTFGREWMPVVFWPNGTHDLYIKTRINSQSTYHRPLLAYYKKWEEGKK